MSINAPAWWYPTAQSSSLTASLLPWALSPASAIYGAIAGHRLERAPSHTSSLPVICIGNFTAGGTGKTPLAIEVARRLKDLGASPAFLTRGYGGSISGPYDIDPNRDIAARTGDEPLLLAQEAPTVVCRDRALGARHIERSDASVIIMDDGLQNPTLAKTLTIAVVDAARGIGNGWAIPSGPLRAPLDRQAARVDAIVMNGTPPEQVLPEISPTRFPVPIMSGKVVPAKGALDLSGRAVVAFSGIGNPARFIRTLEECGAQIRDHFPFADHHMFTNADAEKISAAAVREDAIIVTTEKDRVRLHGSNSESPRHNLLNNSVALPVTFKFTESDASRLDALLGMIVRQTSGY